MVGSKTVIITGGASGIGRAAAKRFAEQDYQVVIADMRKEPREGGKPTHTVIEENGGTTAFVATDVRDWADVQDLVQTTVDRFNRIDVFVNNAGFAERAPITSLAVKDAHKIFRVNIDGVFHGMKAVLPHMQEQGTGSIVNIASGAGKTGFAQLSAYCGSKFAVIGMTESVAKEVDDTDITVNAVCPGRTRTAMTGFEGTPVEDVAETIYQVSQAAYTGRAVDT